jgi:hypothetical protein
LLRRFTASVYRFAGRIGADSTIYLFILLLLEPSLLYILLDKSVWEWDPTVYAIDSVDFYSYLIYSPADWLNVLFVKPHAKAPLIYWVGQFFVPVGILIGSVNKGLLLSVFLANFMALFLSFKIFRGLFGGSVIPLVGCFLVAGSPLFIALSTKFFVEPLLILAVAWFLHILLKSQVWPRGFVLTMLAAASAFALLIKVSALMYCLGPGVAALYYALRGARRKPIRHSRILSYASLALVCACFLFYAHSITDILDYLRSSKEFYDYGSGPFSSISPNMATYSFWLTAFGMHFLPYGLPFFQALFLVSAVVFLMRKNAALSDVFVAISLFQMALVMVALSHAWYDGRYLYPTLLYVAVLVCWSLAKMGSKTIAIAVLSLFLIQYVALNLLVLGIVSFSSPDPYWMTVLDSEGKNEKTVNELLGITCSGNVMGRNVFGNDGASSRWLNGFTLDYQQRKNTLTSSYPCPYPFILHIHEVKTGVGYTPLNPETHDVAYLWETMLSMNPGYYITVDEVYSEDKAYDAVPKIAMKVNESKMFKRIPFPGDENILIFENLNRK